MSFTTSEKAIFAYRTEHRPTYKLFVDLGKTSMETKQMIEVTVENMEIFRDHVHVHASKNAINEFLMKFVIGTLTRWHR